MNRLYGSVSSWRCTRNNRRFHVEFVPAEEMPAYASEAEKLMALISQEQQFIDEHQNYSQLCEEAARRISDYTRRLDEINPIPPSLFERLSDEEADELHLHIVAADCWDKTLVDGSDTSTLTQLRESGMGEF